MARDSAGIDWSGIRANAVTMGIRAAARAAAANLPDIERERFVFRVLKRAAREKWEASNEAAKSSVVVPNAKPLSSNVLNGADSAAKRLAEDSTATRLGFSAAARKIASKIAEEPADLDKDRAQAVRHWSGVASTVHGWDAKQGDDRRTVVNIAILNQ